MNTGKTLFAQVMEFVPWTSFTRIVQRYNADSGVRRLNCAEQFRIMAFAQLTWRESLRDIEVTLGANSKKLYAMGFRNPIRKSTLADANETRDWRVWADLAALLIKRARKLYASEDLGLELDNTVYALDATTIDLCLSLFDWAPFRKAKAAVKLHTLLDLHDVTLAIVKSQGFYPFILSKRIGQTSSGILSSRKQNEGISVNLWFHKIFKDQLKKNRSASYKRRVSKPQLIWRPKLNGLVSRLVKKSVPATVKNEVVAIYDLI